MLATTATKKTVYALEDGDYSDYHVIGIYSSKKKAEAVQAKVGGTIAEWEMDPGYAAINAGLMPWNIVMLRDGTTERVVSAEWSQYSVDSVSGLSIWKRTEAPMYRGKGVPDALYGIVFARDAKHAVKIANEKRTQMIASGEWP